MSRLTRKEAALKLLDNTMVPYVGRNMTVRDALESMISDIQNKLTLLAFRQVILDRPTDEEMAQETSEDIPALEVIEAITENNPDVTPHEIAAAALGALIAPELEKLEMNDRLQMPANEAVSQLLTYLELLSREPGHKEPEKKVKFDRALPEIESFLSQKDLLKPFQVFMKSNPEDEPQPEATPYQRTPEEQARLERIRAMNDEIARQDNSALITTIDQIEAAVAGFVAQYIGKGRRP